MATSMNPVELYHDPSLDDLIVPSRARPPNNGTARRQSKRSGSETSDSSSQPPPAPEVPRGPPISYRGLGQDEGNLQRSFSQRAKGKPFHREVFADLEEEDLQNNMKAKPRMSTDTNRREVSATVPRKPLPSDGLHLDTANLSATPATRAPQRVSQSAREAFFDRDKLPQKPRRISDTPRHTEEPASAISRSSAYRDEAHRRDWAPDRSPLQKLEVTLNDISKEEKRARVQEAEMLLRERDVKANRGLVESPREAASSNKRSTSKRERGVESGSTSLNDAGLVRNLSTAHRQRLQHSTTVDSHRPDVRSLSGEGPPGFEYTVSNTLQTGMTPKSRQSSGRHRTEDEVGQSITKDFPIQAEKLPPRSRRDVTRPSDEGVQSDDLAAPPAHAPQPQGTYAPVRHAPVRRDLAERERNASHKAALEKLTGISAPVNVARSDSRKLQKSPAASVDCRKVSAGSVPSRIPVPAPVTTSRDVRQAVSDHDATHLDSDTSRTQQRLFTPPAGQVLQSSPHPSSPRSPPAKVTDATHHRQRKSSVSFKEPIARRPVDEWKEAGTARLTLADFATEHAPSSDRNKAWWDQPASSSTRRRSRSARTSDHAPFDGPIDDKVAEFKPKLYLRCGPLLRYTGMRRQKSEKGDDREFWRGSVLLVTQDSYSSYDPPPTLRLFPQPQELLPPPPHHVTGGDLDPDYIDPIAGLTKLSRAGRALYVRPVDHLSEGKDLSQIENDDGLFESSPSPSEPTAAQQGPETANKRALNTDSERSGKYQEVKGARLYADPDRDVTFWRFNLEVELAEDQQRIGYRINRGASVGFWVPGRGQTMNMMFHSCNGFSLSVNPDNFSGPDPMWRDVLNTHQTRPFHVMIGGGDQIYNDRVMLETQHFGDWTRMRNPSHKHHAPFTNEMKEELESFYLNRYAMWFSQGLFSMAASQIPMVNIWDDHDIIDGFGSYPHHFMETPVFSGLGNVAFKYYMLFQHQSVVEETTAHEPSWVLGREPGPYIRQLSRSVFMHLGRQVAFLGVDCRTERMRDEVLSVDTVDVILERCRRELVEGETKHLIILLGVPIAYPRLVWLENVLTSRIMDPVKALGRVGVLKGGFLNKFDGGVEILDDLDDHWTATHHKRERNDLVQDFQDLAAEKSCRITILSGDVHLAAVGQFHSNPKLKIPKDKDHRYMPNIISSAIVNTPPSDMLADILNKRNKTHHLDKYTDENMIPMFTHDIDNKKRNNKHMLPRRNWCSIREYISGSTPPSTPPESPDMSEAEEEQQEGSEPRQRRFSFSKEDINPRALFRRLSSRNAPPSSYRDMMYDQGRSASHDGTTQPRSGSGFNQDRNPSGSRLSSGDFQTAPNRRASSFDHTSSGAAVRPGVLRRPTNVSEKAARKGNVPAIDAEGNEFDVNDQINLEGGLDVVLNVEVDQKDPSGITVPYRLLIPALWYDGSSDREKLDEASGVPKKATLLNRLAIGRTRNHKPARQGDGNWGQEQSDEEAYSDGEDGQGAARPKRRFSLFGGRMQKKVETFSDSESDQDDILTTDAGGQGTHQQQPRQPQPQLQSQRLPTATRPVTTSQPRQAMNGPPSHDLLYDTERRPPPSHSLEPTHHPSVRRSLVIRSTSGPAAAVTNQGMGSEARRASSNSYAIPHAGPSRTSEMAPRQLSKQERILGISPFEAEPHEPPHRLRGDGILGKDYPPSAYETHPQTQAQTQTQTQPQPQPKPQAHPQHRGYSGIEAYQEPKPRRTFSLRKAREWLDGRKEDEVEYD
ncbi:hypothetical protein A1O3_09403 [Capronia epimyces CBS 606.96]|uniref:PhoD-like phosphatase domain-containing protein n=1 Tax=Capronia epimyces CBS 606.96 TaxID=1182542 RepID=W9XCM4_9EURO|nr:uncharacterized protein A1O3_09403 [Capronia epimyces CBS 606.96]EXJ78242.1 hypothetical protein A1O3_09403 [Capronia epimyces CBS 606.96]